MASSGTPLSSLSSSDPLESLVFSPLLSSRASIEAQHRLLSRVDKTIQLFLSHRLRREILFLRYVWSVRDFGHRFLCLCSKTFYLVHPETFASGIEYHFAHIQRLVLDKRDRTLVLISIQNKEDVVFQSDERYRIVDEFRIMWKSEYMMRRSRVMHLLVEDKEVDPFPGYFASENAMFPNPPVGFERILLGEHDEYFVFIDDSAFRVHNIEEKKYSDQKNGAYAGMRKMILSDDGKNSILYIFVSPRKIVPYDNRNDKVWCKLEAERVARAQFKDFEDFQFKRSHSYKRMHDLANDPSTWFCHEVHVISDKRSIGVMFLRRKFIPPSADYCQDFCFLFEQMRDNLEVDVRNSRTDLNEDLAASARDNDSLDFRSCPPIISALESASGSNEQLIFLSSPIFLLPRSVSSKQGVGVGLDDSVPRNSEDEQLKDMNLVLTNWGFFVLDPALGNSCRNAVSWSKVVGVEIHEFDDVDQSNELEHDLEPGSVMRIVCVELPPVFLSCSKRNLIVSTILKIMQVWIGKLIMPQLFRNGLSISDVSSGINVDNSALESRDVIIDLDTDAIVNGRGTDLQSDIFLSRLHGIVDTLSHFPMEFGHDPLRLRAKLEMLALDRSSLEWASVSMRMTPSLKELPDHPDPPLIPVRHETLAIRLLCSIILELGSGEFVDMSAIRRNIERRSIQFEVFNVGDMLEFIQENSPRVFTLRNGQLEVAVAEREPGSHLVDYEPVNRAQEMAASDRVLMFYRSTLSLLSRRNEKYRRTMIDRFDFDAQLALSGKSRFSPEEISPLVFVPIVEHPLSVIKSLEENVDCPDVESPVFEIPVVKDLKRGEFRQVYPKMNDILYAGTTVYIRFYYLSPFDGFQPSSSKKFQFMITIESDSHTLEGGFNNVLFVKHGDNRYIVKWNVPPISEIKKDECYFLALRDSSLDDPLVRIPIQIKVSETIERWKFRLSSYLAMYLDGCQGSFTSLKDILEASCSRQNVAEDLLRAHEVIDYLLHIRSVDGTLSVKTTSPEEVYFTESSRREMDQIRESYIENASSSAPTAPKNSTSVASLAILAKSNKSIFNANSSSNYSQSLVLQSSKRKKSSNDQDRGPVVTVNYKSVSGNYVPATVFERFIHSNALSKPLDTLRNSNGLILFTFNEFVLIRMIETEFFDHIFRLLDVSDEELRRRPNYARMADSSTAKMMFLNKLCSYWHPLIASARRQVVAAKSFVGAMMLFIQQTHISPQTMAVLCKYITSRIGKHYWIRHFISHSHEFIFSVLRIFKDYSDDVVLENAAKILVQLTSPPILLPIVIQYILEIPSQISSLMENGLITGFSEDETVHMEDLFKLSWLDELFPNVGIEEKKEKYHALMKGLSHGNPVMEVYSKPPAGIQEAPSSSLISVTSFEPEEPNAMDVEFSILREKLPSKDVAIQRNLKIKSREHVYFSQPVEDFARDVILYHADLLRYVAKNLHRRKLFLSDLLCKLFRNLAEFRPTLAHPEFRAHSQGFAVLDQADEKKLISRMVHIHQIDVTKLLSELVVSSVFATQMRLQVWESAVACLWHLCRCPLVRDYVTTETVVLGHATSLLVHDFPSLTKTISGFIFFVCTRSERARQLVRKKNGVDILVRLLFQICKSLEGQNISLNTMETLNADILMSISLLTNITGALFALSQDRAALDTMKNRGLTSLIRRLKENILQQNIMDMKNSPNYIVRGLARTLQALDRSLRRSIETETGETSNGSRQ